MFVLSVDILSVAHHWFFSGMSGGVQMQNRLISTDVLMGKFGDHDSKKNRKGTVTLISWQTDNWYPDSFRLWCCRFVDGCHCEKLFGAKAHDLWIWRFFGWRWAFLIFVKIFFRIFIFFSISQIEIHEFLLKISFRKKLQKKKFYFLGNCNFRTFLSYNKLDKFFSLKNGFFKFRFFDSPFFF